MRLRVPALVTLLLLLLWLAVGAWALAERHRVIAARELELARATVAVAEQTLRLFKLAEVSIQAVANWITTHENTFPPQDAAFVGLVTELRRVSDGILDIRLVDSRGDLFAIPGTSSKPVANVANNEGVRVQLDPRSRRLYIGDPVISPVNGQWIVPVTYAVPKSNGELVIVAAVLELKSMARILELQRDKPDGSITILKTNGVTLFRSPMIQGTIGKSIAAAPDFVEHLSAVDRGQYRVKGAYDKVDRLVSHVRMTSYPLIIAVTSSVDDALSPWRDELIRIVALGLMVTLATILMTRRLLRIEARSREQLAESEQRFRSFVEDANDVLFALTPTGVFSYVSPRWKEVFGHELGDTIGKPFAPFVHPDDVPACAAFLHKVVSTGQKQSGVEYRVLCKDGSHRWYRANASLVSGAAGDAPTVVGIGRDITEQKQAEGQLQLAASVFTSAHEGITICSPDGTIIDVNETFSRITGYSRDEVLGKNPRILSSGRHNKDFYVAMWRDLIEKGHWYGEIWNKRKGGQVFAGLFTISAVRDVHGITQQYVALFSDITQIKEHQQQLEHIAHYDALTGLPNRVLFADRLHQAMAQTQRRGQQLAVVYLDLDGFKVINDNHGHDAGDQLLIAIATRMKRTLREGDTLARLGGDEFVAVLLDLPDAQASAPMLARLLEAAACQTQTGDLMLQVSASLGITFYPQPEDVDADQLLRQADQAMYQAKLAGKSRYHVFDSEHDRSVRGYHESVERIRLALSQKEFLLYYQPMVNMRTGQVIGAEALIRWQHPERGLLLPAVFLPVIEDHPLAVEVGEWVIDSALTQIEKWRAAGLCMPLSVNVGARQLQTGNFVERLLTLLAAHPAVKPGDLELEVLETSALEDVVLASQVISACSAIGVTFALDDFGTGYSSLTYLKRLPVNLLKIDQSFVHDMLDDPEDLAILDGILGLSSAFHRRVIAEGVETVEQGAMLLQLGCELAQGYAIARPMPAHELAAWSATWRPDSSWFNLQTVSHKDFPLIFAGVEHRVWVRAIEEHLRGEREVPPPLDLHQCPFGMWLDTEGQTRFRARPTFPAIETLHRQAHGLAEELCDLHSRGRNPEALERLPELHALNDTLLDQLTVLALGNAK